jgi:SPOR domain
MPRFRQEEPIEIPIENIPEGAELMAEEPSEVLDVPAVVDVPPVTETVVPLSTPEAIAPAAIDAPGMSIAHKVVQEDVDTEALNTEAPIHHLAAQAITETVGNNNESLSIQNPLALMPETTSFEMFSDEPGTKVERYLAEYRLLQNTEQGGDNLFWAAMQYRQDGLPGKARQLLQSFIRQYPTHPKVPDAQKELYWLDVDTPSESQLFSYEDLNFAAPKTETINPTTGAVDIDLPPQGQHLDFTMPATVQADDEIFLPPPKTEAGVTQSGSVLATEVPQPRYKPEKYDADEMRRQTEKRFSDLEKRSEGSDLWSRFSGNLVGIVIAALITLALIYAVFKGYRDGNLFGGSSSNAVNSANPARSQTENVTVAKPNDNYATLESKIQGEDLSKAPSAAQEPLQAKATINAEDGGFGWQVRHTTRKFEADSLAYSLRQRGYRSGVIDGPEAYGKPGYRVVVGQFKTKEAAKSNRDKLPFDAPAESWVVDIK